MVEAGESNRFQRGAETRLHCRAIHPDLLHRESDFKRDVGAKELRLEVLKYHPDLRGDLANADVIEARLSDHDDTAEVSAFEFRNQPVQALGEGRLARSRRAHDSDHL